MSYCSWLPCIGCRISCEVLPLVLVSRLIVVISFFVRVHSHSLSLSASLMVTMLCVWVVSSLFGFVGKSNRSDRGEYFWCWCSFLCFAINGRCVKHFCIKCDFVLARKGTNENGNGVLCMVRRLARRGWYLHFNRLVISVLRIASEHLLKRDYLEWILGGFASLSTWKPTYHSNVHNS